MSDNRLLRTQRNDVFRTIRKAGLNPLDFKFSEKEMTQNDGSGSLGGVRTDLCHQVIHEPSGYGCLFALYTVYFSPGDFSLHANQRVLDWDQSISAVSAWLRNLKREIDAPDLWASLTQEMELLGLESSEASNAPFGLEEQAQIKRAIDEIRVYITSTYCLAEEPLRRVHAKLDYLIDASTRVGRIDWKNIFVSSLIALALQQLSATGPGLRELFAAAGHLLRHVLGGVISPPLLH